MEDRDRELYERQAATLVASWRAYARHSRDASLIDADGVAIGVFPASPEREVYNNALLARGLDGAGRKQAIERMQSAYRAAAVDRYSAWAHESETDLIEELTAAGYRFDTATRAMAMRLDGPLPHPAGLELGDLDWDGYTNAFLLPGLLAGADRAEFHLRVARLDGRDVGSVIAYDHEGDCGIYNLGTDPAARRRGIGAALTALQLHDARQRGCETASLQATTMAERLYAALGFEDLGRHLEYVPAAA